MSHRYDESQKPEPLRPGSDRRRDVDAGDRIRAAVDGHVQILPAHADDALAAVAGDPMGTPRDTAQLDFQMEQIAGMRVLGALYRKSGSRSRMRLSFRRRRIRLTGAIIRTGSSEARHILAFQDCCS